MVEGLRFREDDGSVGGRWEVMPLACRHTRGREYLVPRVACAAVRALTVGGLRFREDDETVGNRWEILSSLNRHTRGGGYLVPWDLVTMQEPDRHEVLLTTGARGTYAAASPD